MARYRYVSIEQANQESRDTFRIKTALTSRGDWLAWIDALPGCLSWGYTREEALSALQDTVRAYLAALRAQGMNVSVIPGLDECAIPVVTVPE